jgi:hypothetical protein
MSEERIISFKVTLTQKGAEPEFRRFLLDKDVDLSVDVLRRKLSDVFKDRMDPDAEYKLSWTDEDGDKELI